MHQKPNGFSLIQVTILLTLFAITLTAMLPGGQQGHVLKRTENTANHMQYIVGQLKNFTAANGRLPCPADATLPTGSPNYGVEASNQGTTGNCAGGAPAANLVNATSHVAIGALPVKTLGLPNSYALDDYGHSFSYAVDTHGTKGTDCGAASSGGLTVTDSLGNTTKAMMVLISHGANGHGANVQLQGTSGTGTRLNAGSTDTNELKNASVDSSFVSDSTTVNGSFVSKDKSSTYDDLVVTTGKCCAGTICPFYRTTMYVTDGGNHRVQVFDGFGNYLWQFGSSGSGNGEFNSLGSLTIDSGGNIFVADNGNNRVQKFDSSGTYVSQFGSVGSGDGEFNGPNGIVLDNSSKVWVVDSSNSRVQKFDSSGAYQSQFGSGGGGDGEFWGPVGIAKDGSGNLWVPDYGNNRMEKFDSSGVYQSQFGSGGTGPGQFATPTGVAVDASGNIWVADSGNNRIHKFNSSGVHLLTIGTVAGGSGDGEFSWPTGIAFDYFGNVWIVDSFNHRVEEFSSAGLYLRQFGSYGNGNGQFWGPGTIKIITK